jgi:hypothetical protein
MAAEDIAMDFFMRGLDNARNSEFKANLLNDLLVSDTKAPETLNAMYTRSATYILPRNVSRNGKGVVFGVHAFVEDAATKVAEVENAVAEAVLDVAPAKNDKPKAKKPLILWSCGEEGHRLGECPQNNGSEDGDGEERKGFGAVTLRNAFVSGDTALQWYEVLLDNEADVSILDRS